MGFDDYKVVLYRQEDGSWVAEIPALGGCYALMATREAALAELEQVFALIAREHRERGQELPKDTTEDSASLRMSSTDCGKSRGRSSERVRQQRGRIRHHYAAEPRVP